MNIKRIAIRVTVVLLALALLILACRQVANWYKCERFLGPSVYDYLDIREDVQAAEPRFTPQWTPNGDYIVFTARHWEGDGWTGETPIRINVAASDGSGILTITDGYGPNVIEHSPILSPDGWRIAYSSYRFENEKSRYFEIWTAALDGTDRRRLTNKKGLDFAPVWSPDGARINFSRKSSMLYCGYTDDVDRRTVRADGSTIHDVLDRISHALPFSNDSERTDGAPFEGEIFTGGYSSLSPDGSRFAVAIPEHPETALYTVAVDGSDARLLARRGDNSELEAVGSEDRPSADISSCSAGVVVPDPESNPDLVRDCEALVEVIDGIAVSGLNWNADTPIHQWEGVSLDDPDQEDSLDAVVPSALRVRGLSLPERGLIGWLPISVTSLSALRSLDMSNNQLFGPIPPELSELKELRVLKLSRNQLSGVIPPELGNLTELRVLDLYLEIRLDDNTKIRLTGSIPSELGNLTNLRELSLVGFFTGPIPPELGRLANLETLTLIGRFLSPIPPEWGNLSALKTLNILQSQITGPIPPELGNLWSLEVLNLRNNDLIGPVPPELGNLRSLELLNLEGNDLIGPVPPELGNLRSLEVLELTSNNLSGCIPTILREQARVRSHLKFCDQIGQ